MIHPAAIVHPDARIDPAARVDAYAVIDGPVQIGPQCQIDSFVRITGRVSIGSHNRFFSGCVIGETPQDLKYEGQPTEVIIGDHNVFREHVTVHRSNSLAEPTRIGSHNYLMVNSHVGHNCQLANHIMLVNGALLGGHAQVDDRVIISGNCLVHQFVRIGTLALMQGRAGISKDLPPYTVARGVNHISGLNIIGLRRAGISPVDRLELKLLYRLLFLSNEPVPVRLERATAAAQSAPGRTLVEFVASSRRGVCPHAGGEESQEE